jgi:hypothetical protein
MGEPLKQGSMDSLCGIYSILNAYKIVYNLDNEKTQTLFNDIVIYFSKKRMLRGILIGGMALKEMNMVMKDVVYGYMPFYKFSWMGFPNPTTRQYWKSIQNHLTQENNCVIIGTMGRQSHWSVGVSATNKTIKLVDGAWKYLKYNMCTTTILDDGKYILYPAQTIFISNKEF